MHFGMLIQLSTMTIITLENKLNYMVVIYKSLVQDARVHIIGLVYV